MQPNRVLDQKVKDHYAWMAKRFGSLSANTKNGPGLADRIRATVMNQHFRLRGR